MISYEEYYPYGRSAYRAAASGVDLSLKRYRFTGKERDEETGLDYFGVRYYASWLGRWTSGDPGGFVDGLNLYRYVRNNPVNGIDREGYSTEVIDEQFVSSNDVESSSGSLEKSDKEEVVPILPLIIKAASGAAIDFAMQFAINMVIHDFDSSKAMEEIDWISVAWSGAQGANPFSIPGGKWGQAAFDAISDIGINYLNGNYDDLEGEELNEAIFMDVIVGMGTSLLTGEIGERLKPHMHKLGEYLFDKGLTPKRIEQITGYVTLSNIKSMDDVVKHATKSQIKKMFSGNVIPSHMKPGIDEIELAEFLRGKPSSTFDSLPYDAEFDVISDTFMGSAKKIKGNGKSLDTKLKNQVRIMFLAAQATGRQTFFKIMGDGDKRKVYYEYLKKYTKKYPDVKTTIVMDNILTTIN